MYSSMDCTSPIHKERSPDVMSKDADSSQTLSCQRKGGGGGERDEECFIYHGAINLLCYDPHPV